MDINECRLYVCRSYFGNADSCKRFQTWKDYLEWLAGNDTEMTSFQPICNKIEIFDKLVLTYRSGKVNAVEIK